MIAANAADWSLKLLQPILAAAVLIGLWELGVQLTGVSKIILPAPSLVAETSFKFFPLMIEQASPTFWAAVWGILASAVLGIFLGTLVSYSKTVMGHDLSDRRLLPAHPEGRAGSRLRPVVWQGNRSDDPVLCLHRVLSGPCRHNFRASGNRQNL